MKKLLLHVAEVLLDSAIGALCATVIFTEPDWRVVVSAAVISGVTGLLIGLRVLLEEKAQKLKERKGAESNE